MNEDDNGRGGESAQRVRELETRLLETSGQLTVALGKNEKLTATLREAREQVSQLRNEVDKLSQPPASYGVVLGTNDDGTVDVHVNGRKMRVSCSPSIDAPGPVERPDWRDHVSDWHAPANT